MVKESHLAIHTWPEYSFASVDIFICGCNSRPYESLNYIIEKLKPIKVHTDSIERGRLLRHEYR